MVITPSTELILLRSPLEEGDYNQLDFASATAQEAYFRSLPHLEVDNFTYQRKDNVIRMSGSFDDLITYNYVMYKNEAYSEKWFYAFISRAEYINDNTTYLYIKTDVFQTWQFDIEYKPCFIERETVLDDTFGIHTIPEGLNLGEFVENDTTVVSLPDTFESTEVGASQITLEGSKSVCFQLTELLSGTISDLEPNRGRIYNGLYSGLYLLGIPISAPTGYASAVDTIIRLYAEAGKADAIVSIFVAPSIFFNGGKCAKVTDSGAYICSPPSSEVMRYITSASANRGTTIDGYTPRNNKLFTSEFNHLYMTNYAGGETIYNYEDGQNGTIDFTVEGVISQGSAIKIFPNVYKNMDQPIQYGLNAGKYPQCAWAKDYYTNWATQNAVNIKTGIINSLIGSATSFNLAGIASSATTSVLSAMAQVKTAEIVPNQAQGNVNAGDYNLARDLLFDGFRMSVRNEIAQTIDKYFDMYGYKVNTVKVPQIRGRENWNYTKTIDAYIEGDSIPQDDLNEIKGMFDSGIRVWHNPANFMDYSKTNNIV